MSKLSPSKKAEFKRLSANVDKDYSQFEVQVRVLHQIDCASADWSWLFAMHQLVDAAFVVLWQSVSELFYFLEEDELETAEVKALMDTLIGERLKYVVDSLSRLEEAFKIGRAKQHKFWTLVNPSTSIRPHISLRPQAWVADVYEEEPAAVIEHLKTTLNDEGASFFQLLQGFNEQCRLFSSDTLCMDNMPSIQVSMWYRDIKKAYDNHYEAFFCLWGHVQDHPDEWVVDSELHKIGEDIVEELEVFVTLRQWRESMEELRDIYLDDKAQAALEKELKDLQQRLQKYTPLFEIELVHTIAQSMCGGKRFDKLPKAAHYIDDNIDQHIRNNKSPKYDKVEVMGILKGCLNKNEKTGRWQAKERNTVGHPDSVALLGEALYHERLHKQMLQADPSAEPPVISNVTLLLRSLEGAKKPGNKPEEVLRRLLQGTDESRRPDLWQVKKHGQYWAKYAAANSKEDLVRIASLLPPAPVQPKDLKASNALKFPKLPPTPTAPAASQRLSTGGRAGGGRGRRWRNRGKGGGTQGST